MIVAFVPGVRDVWNRHSSHDRPLNGMRIKSGLVVEFDSPPWHLTLNDMIMKKEFWHLVALVGVIVAICLAGRYDYNDEVMYHMSDGTYQALREKLGNVSSTELVDVYMSDCEYWDSLGRLK